jgi:hypothetical protein
MDKNVIPMLKYVITENRGNQKLPCILMHAKCALWKSVDCLKVYDFSIVLNGCRLTLKPLSCF